MVAASTATLILDQNRQVKHMSQKIILNDVKSTLIATMQNDQACLSNVSTLTFDSTIAGNKSMSPARIRNGQSGTSPVLVEKNLEIAPGSRLFVDDIFLDELTDIGGGKWSGIWKVVIRNNFSNLVYRPIALNPQTFDVNLATPAAANITACHAVVAGAGGIWSVTGSSDLYYNSGKVGIGTATPTVPFHVKIGRAHV